MTSKPIPKPAPKQAPQIFQNFSRWQNELFLTLSFLTDLFTIFQAGKIWFFRLHFGIGFGVILGMVL